MKCSTLLPSIPTSSLLFPLVPAAAGAAATGMFCLCRSCRSSCEEVEETRRPPPPPPPSSAHTPRLQLSARRTRFRPPPIPTTTTGAHNSFENPPLFIEMFGEDLASGVCGGGGGGKGEVVRLRGRCVSDTTGRLACSASGSG